ncbi:NADH-quinone oxidoreductase subunit M [Thermanaerosceptrum fracticalcis]|uniref:NADH-quinone oxidoreductase subunit M n=1 Tax=Thermanaerosceptrum fracticalcis TaxID=1712410 RepID=A0A7G6E1G4_THEFR|nr:NADH-quinone oxidoreductase subunit M [Thermanaerosceptrum fracticalcis]QNB45918.1 NADH-quinone oxidoreductase subunit M [Thermanaerosceptrum fracticalcis]
MGMPLLSIIVLAPILGALIILFIPENEDRIIKWVAALFTGVSLIASIYVYVSYDQAKGGLQFLEDIPWIEKFGINYSLGVDGISLPLVLLTAIVIFTGVFASWGMTKRVKEFFIFLLTLVAGVFGVFVSRDLFFFYLFFEVAVIPMYILIGVWGSTRKEYAAMKLTLYLLVGSAFALIGVIAVYLYTGLGTFDIQALTAFKYDPFFQKFAFFLMMVGFGFLVPMWPLHTWSPDGHVAAPTAVSMLHAGVLMKLGGYGLVRAGIFLFPEGAVFWSPVIGLLCIVNVVYGAMVAMAQKDLKFVIGYSSVSHMGYVLLGIAALNTISINGAVAQMFAHGIMTALFFALVGVIYDKAHTRVIADFGGLAYQMPRVATGFVIAGLASLGLPGLNNFVAEFLIFVGAYKTYPILAILAVSGVVITAVYVLRVVQKVFFGPVNPKWADLTDAKGAQMVPIVVLCGVLILFGFFPSLLIDVINNGVDPFVNTYLKHITVGGGF